MSLEILLENILTNPTYLAAWALLVVGSLAVLVWDLWTNNAAIGSLMKFVWGFTESQGESPALQGGDESDNSYAFRRSMAWQDIPRYVIHTFK